jgi:hypothetical protein
MQQSLSRIPILIKKAGFKKNAEGLYNNTVTKKPRTKYSLICLVGDLVQDKYENLKVQLLKQKEYSDHVHLEYQKLEAQLEQRTGQQAEGIFGSSVADPECLSWILIFTHPGSKNSNKRVVLPFWKAQISQKF